MHFVSFSEKVDGEERAMLYRAGNLLYGHLTFGNLHRGAEALIAGRGNLRGRPLANVSRIPDAEAFKTLPIHAIFLIITYLRRSLT